MELTKTTPNKEYIKELKALRKKFQIDDKKQVFSKTPKNKVPSKEGSSKVKQIRSIKGALPEEYTKDSSRFLRTTEMVLH